jgi:hypothetical protein
MNLFDEDEISGLFEPESHLGSSAQIVDRSIEIARDESSEK